MSASELTDLDVRRGPLFDSLADLTLDTLRDTGEVVVEIAKYLQAVDT